MTKMSTLSLALVLAAGVSASPALAQSGNGNGRGQKQEARDNRRDRDDDDRRDDRRLDRRDRNGARFVLSGDRRTLTRNGRRVPPGWCIGRGNPHNTPANCGGFQWNSRRTIWDRLGIGDRTDDRRRDDRRDVFGSSGSSGSHANFHLSHDRRCSQLAAEAGTNARRLLEVRAQCRAVHNDYHRRAGSIHR